jgi:U5 small nuclear ribonucleoprotein component
LKLPPEIALIKLRRVIQEIQTNLRQQEYPDRVSPELFNVAFTSAQFFLCFTAESIGRIYNRKPKVNYKFDRTFQMSFHAKQPDGKSFGARICGDYRSNPEQKTIISSSSSSLPHPFFTFILEPLYKVFSHVLSHDPPEWSRLRRIPITPAQQKLNVIPLLRIALSHTFGSYSSLVQVIAEFCPIPHDKIPNSSASTVAFVPKFVPSADGNSAFGLARVHRGCLTTEMSIIALGNDFEDNRESHQTVVITKLALSHVRYLTPIDTAYPGMIVKIDVPLRGIATLTDIAEVIFPRLQIPVPLLKIGIEPLDPSKNQQMLESLDRALLCYSSLQVQGEANGDRYLLGTGELMMDCVLHDIRNSFASIEVKVSDPFVVFNETVAIRSVTICRTKIDDENSIGVIAEPIRPETAYDLDNGNLTPGPNLPEQLLRLGWDELAADNVWAFGPDSRCGPNILVDDVLPPKPTFSETLRSVIQRSFTWSCRVGPLCDEMIRGVLFRIVEVQLGVSRPIIPAKFIPAVRKALFAAFLAANPRLVEPVYLVEIQTTNTGIPICVDILKQRRGEIVSINPLQGTPLTIIKGRLPLMDSFGLEVDICRRTAGQAFPLSFFEPWDIVPGDPLDGSFRLKPLEPSPAFALGREFVVKTRRRKGLPDDVDVSKYADRELLIEIAQIISSHS